MHQVYVTSLTHTDNSDADMLLIRFRIMGRTAQEYLTGNTFCSRNNIE